MTKNEIIQAQLEALAIFDANNTMMTVKECAEFLGKCERTILNRIHSDDPHNKIYAEYKGGWVIPKIQFLDKLIDSYSTRSTSLKVS